MNSVRTNRISLVVENATVGLARFLHSGLQQKLEPVRLARAGYVLFLIGCSRRGTFPEKRMAAYLRSVQRLDGGWGDVEETLWCLGCLGAFDDRCEVQSPKGMEWLRSVRLPCGAWGRNERDQPRIPVTALASALVPDLVDRSGLEWIASQWNSDLGCPTQLTYKGAFFLLSQAHSLAPEATDLVDRTIQYLCREQEHDGGFGPWKGHPVGSDPWTTGVVLWGLSRFSQQASADVTERAVNWLKTKQLPNGLWPYHYLDDATSMALIGLSSVLPLLRES